MIRTAKLGQERWKVRRVCSIDRTVLARKKERRDGGYTAGLADPETCTLYVEQDQDPRQQAATLLHEMIHAVDPSLSEPRVLALEADLAPVLWRTGWRPFEKEDK
jgi:hypothetical protein